MEARVPEQNKKPGLHYATTSDGVELPIVDVTHGAFALAVTDDEQRRGIEQFLAETKRVAKIPRPIRRALLKLFLRGSILGRGIQTADGTFLDASTTCLLKLGPDNLGSAYT